MEEVVEDAEAEEEEEEETYKQEPCASVGLLCGGRRVVNYGNCDYSTSCSLPQGTRGGQTLILGVSIIAFAPCQSACLKLAE